MTYFYDGLHIDAEYAQGRGMIGNGVQDVSSDAAINDWQSQNLLSSDTKADGYYIATTYEVFKNLELLGRYDRITNNKKLYRVFETYTTGFSYKFKNYNRFDVNYATNSINAPYNSVAQNILNAVGDQLSLQVTILFK